MTRKTYRRNWLRLRGIYEKMAFRRFHKAILRAMSNFPYNEITEENYDYVTREFITNKPIAEAFEEVYFAIGSRHGKKIREALRKEIAAENKALSDPDPDYVQRYKNFIKEWVLRNAGTKIKSVRESLIKEVLRIISEGIENRENIRDLAQNLQDRIGNPNFYYWQSMRIARTETTAAANLGAIRAADDAEVLYEKEWISTLDKRTRRRPQDEYDHWDMDGARVDEGKEFNVDGDMLQYPGESGGSAGNVINCRCTVVLLIKRDANGRIMMKPTS